MKKLLLVSFFISLSVSAESFDYEGKVDFVIGETKSMAERLHGCNVQEDEFKSFANILYHLGYLNGRDRLNGVEPDKFNSDLTRID